MKKWFLASALFFPLAGFYSAMNDALPSGWASIFISTPSGTFSQESSLKPIAPNTYGTSLEKSMQLPSGVHVSVSSSSTVVLPDYTK